MQNLFITLCNIFFFSSNIRCYDSKNISNDIDDRVNINIANLSGILTGVLTLQITLTKYSNKISKTGKVLNALPKNEFVNITIYNSNGKVVKTLVNSFQSAGYNTINWDATDNRNKPISSGVYIYRLQSDSHIDTKKMILLR